MSVPMSTRVSASRLRAQSALSLLATALLAAVCVAQLGAQNAPASVSVDANANRHPINPNIYGFSFATTSDLATLNAPLNRFGGNSSSMYNWQVNALNTGNDWYFETYLQDNSTTPGEFTDTFIKNTRAADVGAQAAITIPMIGYLAKLGANQSTLASFSIAKYGPQTASDPWNPDAGNGISTASGNPPITGNNPLDANTPNSVAIQQAWVQHFIGTWGLAANGGLKYYVMDNEPSIWSSTHRDVHPNPETYSEIYGDFVNYAGAIRALDPNAIIVGPEEWGWWPMFLSGLDQKNGAGANGSDYSTHNNTYYYPWLLQQLYSYQQSSGKQLINVLSAHCYNAIPDGSDDSTSGQHTRNQETRILWDPTFVDPSWYGQVGINGGIVDWIPTLKNWVTQYYPGLQTACTEYNWGDEPNLNGATTQADVLGIYGREGLDIATRWTVPANPSPTYLSMQIFRNYDGKLSTFGDTSVSASVANPDYLSSFAAVRSSDGALTVIVINKQQGSTLVTVSLANFGTTGTAQAWQIASASQTAITSLGSVPVTSNALSVTVPAQSITLFVIPAGSVTSPPTAPNGLAATVGSGTVTLTWAGGGGATSYTVKRGTVSGGPYATLGTTTVPSYTDTGLTNGTAYYYVVSATNSAGTSPNSTELAVTPIMPPTFTSSANASPNPVTQGTSTTISATLTCTANTLTNGVVQIYVLDPSGNAAATQNFAGQSFTPNQSHPYSLALTPALAGTYTIQVGVFSATWQTWYWNSAAASITVKSSTAFTSSVTAPSTVALGGAAAISFTVTETGAGGLTNGNVELQIFSVSGTAMATNVWSGQNFTAGQTNTYSYTWSPVSGTVAPGTYSIDVGVFNSSWSVDYYWNTDATITVTSGSSPPPAPAGLKATAGNAQVSLSWTASSGATSYNVYRGTSAGGESPTPIATGVTATSYTNTGLTNGTTYYYKVAAVNAAGTSGLSAEASAMPQLSAPPAPTGLKATAGNAQVSLSWTASSGAASYNVYRGTSSGGEGTTPITTGVTTTSYVNTGLTNGKTYYYKVAAVNAGGTSALSAEASATPRRR